MTARQVSDTCSSLGLTVRQVPSDGRRRSWSAGLGGPDRVYWSTSFEGGLLGGVRVCRHGRDTHARTAGEIAYIWREYGKPG